MRVKLTVRGVVCGSLWASGAAVGMAGCAAAASPEVPLVCTEQAVSGLSVTVRDAATQAGLARQAQVVATATVGTYADTLRTGSDVTLYGVVERPGTYRVQVAVPGYRSAPDTTVVIPSDGCHPIPQTVTRRLSPAQP